MTGPAPGLGQHTDEVLAERWDAGPVRAADRVARPGVDPARSPLQGLRVLDLGNFLAGPLGPMLLADLGAEVVKVEATTGDQMRPIQRVFASCQRGKRGVALDLKSPDAQPALEALVRWADVVHHNLRRPAARRLGIDEDAIRAISPDVVSCHASSYGPLGERADWPGYDQLFQACAGWEVLGGGEGNDPMWFRFGFMDHLCAMGSTVATLLAVLERDRTGRGQHVTGSLLGAAVLTNGETYLDRSGAAVEVATVDGDQMGTSPGHRLYPLADGWLALAACSPDHLAATCSALGVSGVDGLEASFARAPVRETVEALRAAGVPCERVGLDQGASFLDDPLIRSLGLVTSYPHAEWGALEQVGAFWGLGDLEVSLDRAPPALGQHTVEVLLEAGMDPADIDVLVAGAVAVQAVP